MFNKFELIDVAGIFILILLVASVAVIVVATPEVAERDEPPDSDWTVQKVNDSHMEVRHLRGEPVAMQNLTVIIGEYPRPVKWSGNVSGGYVREGGYASIEVSEGETIAVYWSSSEDTIRMNLLAEGEY
jgi:hypothetical protein